MIYTLRPDWDKPPMSMNDHDIRQVEARKTAEIRQEIYQLALAAKIPPMPKISVRMIWTVPDRKRRDQENPTLTYKAVCDALAAPTVTRTRRGVKVSPGALIVPDDVPEYMEKHLCQFRYEKGVSKVEIEIEEVAPQEIRRGDNPALAMEIREIEK